MHEGWTSDYGFINRFGATSYELGDSRCPYSVWDAQAFNAEPIAEVASLNALFTLFRCEDGTLFSIETERISSEIPWKVEEEHNLAAYGRGHERAC